MKNSVLITLLWLCACGNPKSEQKPAEIPVEKEQQSTYVPADTLIEIQQPTEEAELPVDEDSHYKDYTRYKLTDSYHSLPSNKSRSVATLICSKNGIYDFVHC